VNEAIVGHNRPGDPAGFTDRQFRAMNIAGEFAVDLHFAIADNIAGHLHAGAQYGRRAGRAFLGWLFIL
jgi:hypothetical protein